MESASKPGATVARIPLRGAPDNSKRPAQRDRAAPLPPAASSHESGEVASPRRATEGYTANPAHVLRPFPPDSRTDAAAALDRELVALSGVEARSRLIRARIVARIIERKAWHPLGFVRLSDFAHEGLGASARSLEEDARIIRAIEVLPAMRASLESGRLAWTRAGKLVRIATPANEAKLLRESTAVPYRELDVWLQQFASLEKDGESSEARPVRIPAETSGIPDGERGEVRPLRIATETTETPAASTTSDDPILRWSIQVSPSGRRYWRAACEFASRSAGSSLSSAQVLELVAAEASSAVSESVAGTFTRRDSLESHELRFRARAREREMRGRRALLGFLADTGAAEGFDWLEPNSREPGPAASLLPLEEGLDEADAFELERRLQMLRPIAQRADTRIAALLRTGIERRLFQELGFANAKLYVESRLGMSSRSAWNLVAIERESWRRSPLLHGAWREGRITPLQALALLPIVETENANAWIERAGEVTLRRLRDEVAWVFDRNPLPSSVQSVMPPALDADVRPLGIADLSLAEVQNIAHGEIRPAPAEVALDFCAPISVLVLVESTLDRLQRTYETRGQTFERMVALALVEWLSAPRHRDPVFERDGWRCAVPACSSRCQLHDHHLKFRSVGGGGERSNRITVCAGHHLRGIHMGIIRAEGRAPDEILWKMPLATLSGDRYVDRRGR